MPEVAFSPPLTQRAYTLRLDGLNQEQLSKMPETERKVAEAWKESLWRTHEAVNKGAHAFGDWLLTMRGGLGHELAERTLNKGKKPSPEEVRNRRVLLALSWLSVESKVGSPKRHWVAERPQGSEKTLEALMVILEKRGLKAKERADWGKDCGSSLNAAIREDAVWVDRSACFDELREELGSSLTRGEAEQTVFSMLDPAEVYFHLDASDGEGEADALPAPDGPKSSNAGRGWLSFQWGKGEKSDNAAIANALKRLAKLDLQEAAGLTGGSVLRAIAKKMGIKGELEDPAEAIRLKVGWKTGRPSKGRMALDKLVRMDRVSKAALEEFVQKVSQESEAKGGDQVRQVQPWSAKLRQKIERAVGFAYDMERDLIGEYSVMLDHALRRVSGGHSWIKNAEEERLAFEGDARKSRAVPDSARSWLDAFCEARSTTSGSLEGYRIRRRALGGWKDLVAKWKKLGDQDEAGRVREAKTLQDELEGEKYGDIELFIKLAAVEALSVWKRDGKADAQILLNYAAASDAVGKQRRFKVPAYRHPDSLNHPVFCDFGNSRWDIRYTAHDAAEKGGSWLPAEMRKLEFQLWDGKRLGPVPLRWRSKKLFGDLSLESDAAKGKNVTRSDRLGRAVVNADKSEPVKILSLFQEKEWNGRLQVPRDQLESLARYLENNGGIWDEQALVLRSRLGWFVSFSAKLQPQGPWIDYLNKQELRVSKRNGWPLVQGNKARGSRSKLGLCRLPDLRVLSVDLGHRYAAACAVWQVLSQRDLEKACERAKVRLPDAGAVSYSLKEGKRDVLHRRIAMDSVKVDEATGEIFQRAKLHPGPWARLDRQFLVKLQGEDAPARFATEAELVAVNELEKQLGHSRKEGRKGDARRVDALQVEALDLCRQGLRLHGDAARIAFRLTAKVGLMPGGKSKTLSEVERADLLADTLALWRSRFGAGIWQDAWAKQMWGKHVQLQLKGIQLEDGADGESGRERKGRQAQWKKNLLPLAQDWVKQDLGTLSSLWKTRWTADDGGPARTRRGKVVGAADGWYARLRWLHDWLLPRGAKGKNAQIRDVGGLSLGRIAAFKALYQLQKAHRMRPEPDNLRKNVPEEGDDALTDYGQSVLEAMERLRQNRVKQLASRLGAAALGLDKDLKPRRGDPRFAPCHAIVVENLERYRPEEVRTRRENRQLMDWSSAKVWKYLSETCELNGLHLRAVSPAYTSRQDSRTGTPGRRCKDVDAEDFFRESGFWAIRVHKAGETQEQNGYDKLLIDIWNRWKGKTKKGQAFRLPVAGGELFVSADRHSPAAKGLQADLNAAANIGLRALLDPDWPGAWWYVPCEEQADGSWKPVKKDIQGSLCPGVEGPLIRAKETATTKTRKAKRDDSEASKVMNLWQDISTEPLRPGPWKFHKDYWAGVEDRVLGVLRVHNGVAKA